MKCCERCSRAMPAETHPNRRFCDPCRKAKRAIVDFIRSQLPGRKEYQRERVKRYRQKNHAKVLAKQRERYYRYKVNRAAHAEARERGVNVETVLRQWGAL